MDNLNRKPDNRTENERKADEALNVWMRAKFGLLRSPSERYQIAQELMAVKLNALLYSSFLPIEQATYQNLRAHYALMASEPCWKKSYDS